MTANTIDSEKGCLKLQQTDQLGKYTKKIEGNLDKCEIILCEVKLGQEKQ